MFRSERLYGVPWRGSPFHRGDLKYIVLELIAEKPCYGYEIIRELEDRFHGFYSPSPGAVYPTLQMLEEMGYATAAERDGKRIYTITDGGRRFLEEHKDFAQEIKEQIRARWNAENVVEMRKMMGEFARFRHLVGRRMRHVDPEKIRRIRDVVSRSYEEIEKILDER